MIEYFDYDPRDVKESASARLAEFFRACGLIGDDERKEIEPRDAVGKKLVVELVDNESGEERKGVKIDPSDGMWRPGDDAARDVPTVRDDD